MLEVANIPYAVIGGNAVAAWVSRVDREAVRNTRDVDILLRSEDFNAAKIVMEKAGFVYRHVKSVDMFLDGPGAKTRSAMHVLFAGEKVSDEDLVPAPKVEESEADEAFQVIRLEALVRMKLTSFRRKDQVHLLDMIELGLLNEDWPAKYPGELGQRLQTLLDDPDG